MPADNEVNVIFSGDPSRLLKAHEQMAKGVLDVIKGLVQAKQAYRELGVEGEKTGKGMGTLFAEGVVRVGEFTASLAGMGSALASVQTLIAAVRAEVEIWRQRNASAADAQTSAAQAEMLLIQAMGTTEPGADPQQALARISRLSAETGIPYPQLARVFAAGLQAKGGAQSVEDVMDTTAYVAHMGRFMPPDELNPLVTATMKLRGIFGGSPEEVFGVLQGITEASGVESMSKASQNLIPTVVSLAQTGLNKDSLEFYGALTTTMGNLMGDPHGRRSATATLSLYKQLDEIRKTANPKSENVEQFLQWLHTDQEGRKVRDSIVSGTSPFTMQLLDALGDGSTLEEWQNRAQMLKKGRGPKVHGEYRSTDAMIAMLQGPDAIMPGGATPVDWMNRSRNLIPDLGDESAGVARRLEEQYRKSPNIGQATTQARLREQIEKIKRENLGGGAIAIVNSAMDEFLKANPGTPEMGRKLDRIKREWIRNYPESAKGVYSQEKDLLYGQIQALRDEQFLYAPGVNEEERKWVLKYADSLEEMSKVYLESQYGQQFHAPGRIPPEVPPIRPKQAPAPEAAAPATPVYGPPVPMPPVPGWRAPEGVPLDPGAAELRVQTGILSELASLQRQMLGAMAQLAGSNFTGGPVIEAERGGI